MGTDEGVSSLTMALSVFLVVKAGLLFIALVAILYRYTNNSHQGGNVVCLLTNEALPPVVFF